MGSDRSHLERTVEKLNDEVELLMLEQRAVAVDVRRQFARECKASHFVLQRSQHCRENLEQTKRVKELRFQREQERRINSHTVKLQCFA